MKTSQNPNHGLVKFSHLHQISNTGDISTTSTSKQSSSISKYFTVQECSRENTEHGSSSQTSECYESPYKNAVTEIKYVPSNDGLTDAFKTPKAVRKITKIFQTSFSTNKQSNPKKSKTRASKKKFSNRGNYIIKITEDNFGQSDINPDHLQLALALSKSTYAAENPGKPKDIEDLPTIHSPIKIRNVKTTLEKYGFKSEKPKLCQEQRINTLGNSRKNKYSKFRFVTPTLKTRADEDRKSIVASKISLILSQNKYFQVRNSQNEAYNELFSDFLKEFHRKSSIILTYNRLSLQETYNFSYYTESLNINPTKYRCGCLLKKWEEIPGREKSPDRGNLQDVGNPLKGVSKDCNFLLDVYKIEATRTDSGLVSPYKDDSTFRDNLIKEVTPTRNSVSPDLFASDSELDYLSVIPENYNIPSKPSMSLTPAKKQSLLNSSSSASSSESSDFKMEKCDILNCEIFNTDTGIRHFESYCDNLEHLSQKVYFLNETTENRVNKDNELKKVCLNPLRGDETQIIYDLTQNSSSDEDVNGSCRGNINCNNQNSKIIDKSSYEKCKQASHDLIESPRSNKSITDDFNVQTTNAQHLDYEDVTRIGNTNLTNLAEQKYTATPIFMETDFDGSSLQIQKSPQASKYIDEPQESNYKRTTSFDGNLSNFDSSILLNVTDYVNKILDGDTSIKQGNESVSLENPQSDDEVILSQTSCSQESIIISDEELNYSSVHSKNIKNKSFYYLSDTDNLEENCGKLRNTEEINNVHLVLRNKYGKQELSSPVHSRYCSLPSRESLAKVFLDDPFNDIEDPNILVAIENENGNDKFKNAGLQVIKTFENEIVTKEENNCEDTISEKFVSPATEINSTATPENNLIIKTKNITPMVNYDEMDTPKITTQLEKFGLKPLKRQRGIKLLKYLYDCTHPLVTPSRTDELSSDDDHQRVFKKRKKCNQIIDCSKSYLELEKQEGFDDDKQIEQNVFVEKLSESENLDELIFERKYSTKIPSCRVPLQIVWHNFMCNNPKIKENVLLYEPLYLEEVHSKLKQQSGCKFHIQDLLMFLDRKCVTIRTAQTQGSRRKQRNNSKS